MNGWAITGIIIGGCIFIIAGAQIGVFLFQYTNCEERSIIGFDEFLDYWTINPDRWDLDADKWSRISYRAPEPEKGIFFYSKSYQFRFNFIDYIRYYRWVGRYFQDRNLGKLARQQTEDMTGLLQCVQKDIDKLKAQADKEIAEVKAQTESVSERYNVNSSTIILTPKE